MKIKILLTFAMLICCINAYADNAQNDSDKLSATEKQKLEKLFLGTQTSKSSQEDIQTKPLPTIISSVDENDESKKESLSGNDLAVTLIRFAWQQLYAPERLQFNNKEFSRTPMHANYFVNNLIYGDKVYSHPIASWELNDTYVTAVELRNKYPHDAVIHLNHDICGDWLSASIYPNETLKEAGNKTKDSAVLFLLSDKPFSDAMRVCNGLA